MNPRVATGAKPVEANELARRGQTNTNTQHRAPSRRRDAILSKRARRRALSRFLLLGLRATVLFTPARATQSSPKRCARGGAIEQVAATYGRDHRDNCNRRGHGNTRDHIRARASRPVARRSLHTRTLAALCRHRLRALDPAPARTRGPPLLLLKHASALSPFPPSSSVPPASPLSAFSAPSSS